LRLLRVRLRLRLLDFPFFVIDMWPFSFHFFVRAAVRPGHPIHSLVFWHLVSKKLILLLLIASCTQDDRALEKDREAVPPPAIIAPRHDYYFGG